MSDPSAVKITVDYSEVTKFFQDLRGKMPTIHKTALRRMGEEIIKLIKANWLTGQALNVRTGRLRSSIDYVVDTPSKISVGTNVVYGAIHEYGGTITPKNGMFLTIPLTKYAERFVGGAKAMTDLFVWAPGGWNEKAFLARTTGKRGKLSLEYMLVRSVTIPKRPYIRPAIDYYVGNGRADAAVKWAIKTCVAKWTQAIGG